ncbi:MAG: DUF5666 domain-containing protein [Woeseiaceae bacterium]
MCLTLIIGACGGSGVNISSTVNVPPIPLPPPQPAVEPVSAVGVVTALGSVTINGVQYETDSATVTMNGQAATFSAVELGQIVSVEGTIEVNGPRGIANSVDYEATLIGPVENIDAALGQLVVMGQTVLTDTDTVFDASIDPTGFAGITVGSNLQVSGFLNADGSIDATRVEPDDVTSGVQLVGSISGLDLANLLFSLNRLTVDYSAATLMDIPGGAPAEGMFVLVRGQLASGILVVDEIAGLYGTDGTPGRRTQTQGTITRFVSSTDFDVNGFRVTTDAGTGFVNGTISDLQADVEITIDGEVAEGGNAILANVINFGRVVDSTTTMTFDFRDFTEISVGTVFNVAVSQGPEFSIEVTIDADEEDRVSVTQSGSTLSLGLLQGDGNIQTLQAVVTMPVLESIILTGVVNATVSDFSQAQMMVNVGGVSRLTGNGLIIGNLTAIVSGVSQLNFGNIHPLGTTNIDVGGVSQATLNMGVGTTLTGSVGTGQGSGVSALFYYGTDVIVSVTTDGLSSVNRLGDTRP